MQSPRSKFTSKLVGKKGISDKDSLYLIQEYNYITTIMSPDIYFRQHLTKQLGFLARSCKSYDEGHIDEGIRIATVIRVLVHDTKNCVSLLKHLGATNINLASTVANLDASRWVMFWGMGQFT